MINEENTQASQPQPPLPIPPHFEIDEDCGMSLLTPTKQSTPSPLTQNQSIQHGHPDCSPAPRTHSEGPSSSSVPAPVPISAPARARRPRVKLSRVLTEDQYPRTEPWVLHLNGSETRVDAVALNLVAVYVIQVSHGVEEPREIVRRFSQFYELDLCVRPLCPSVQLPKLPSRYVLKSGTDPLLMKERTAALQDYLDDLAQSPEATASRAFLEWVAPPAPQNLISLAAPELVGPLTRVGTLMRPSRDLMFVLKCPLLLCYERTPAVPTKILSLYRAAVKVAGAGAKEGGEPKTLTVTAKNGDSFVLEKVGGGSGNALMMAAAAAAAPAGCEEGPAVVSLREWAEEIQKAIDRAGSLMPGIIAKAPLDVPMPQYPPPRPPQQQSSPGISSSNGNNSNTNTNTNTNNVSNNINNTNNVNNIQIKMPQLTNEKTKVSEKDREEPRRRKETGSEAKGAKDPKGDREGRDGGAPLPPSPQLPPFAAPPPGVQPMDDESGRELEVFMELAETIKTLTDRHLRIVLNSLRSSDADGTAKAGPEVRARLEEIAAAVIGATTADILQTEMCPALVAELRGMLAAHRGDSAIGSVLYDVSQLARLAEGKRNLTGEPLGPADKRHSSLPDLTLYPLAASAGECTAAELREAAAAGTSASAAVLPTSTSSFIPIPSTSTAAITIQTGAAAAAASVAPSAPLALSSSAGATRGTIGGALYTESGRSPAVGVSQSILVASVDSGFSPKSSPKRKLSFKTGKNQLAYSAIPRLGSFPSSMSMSRLPDFTSDPMWPDKSTSATATATASHQNNVPQLPQLPQVPKKRDPAGMTGASASSSEVSERGCGYSGDECTTYSSMIGSTDEDECCSNASGSSKSYDNIAWDEKADRRSRRTLSPGGIDDDDENRVSFPIATAEDRDGASGGSGVAAEAVNRSNTNNDNNIDDEEAAAAAAAAAKAEKERRKRRRMRRNKHIVCRICEEKYPQSQLGEHTEYCVEAQKIAGAQDMSVDERILALAGEIEATRRSKEASGKDKESSNGGSSSTTTNSPEGRPTCNHFSSAAYTKLFLIGRSVCTIVYGDEYGVARCWNLLYDAEVYLARAAVGDVFLTTYGRVLCRVIEEKYHILKDVLAERIQEQQQQQQQQQQRKASKSSSPTLYQGASSNGYTYSSSSSSSAVAGASSSMTPGGIASSYSSASASASSSSTTSALSTTLTSFSKGAGYSGSIQQQQLTSAVTGMGMPPPTLQPPAAMQRVSSSSSLRKRYSSSQGKRASQALAAAAAAEAEVRGRQQQNAVRIEDFRMIKQISSGAYGRVFLARKKTTNDLYAIKVLRKKDMFRKNMKQSVMVEKMIMSSVINPFVVKLYYAFQSREDLYLVMEYYPGGDVGTLLKNLGAFDLAMTRIYAAETVLALESIHRLNYVHRDLKPDNMLISATGHVVLTDFGLSTIGIIYDQAARSTKDGEAQGSSSGEASKEKKPQRYRFLRPRIKRKDKEKEKKEKEKREKEKEKEKEKKSKDSPKQHQTTTPSPALTPTPSLTQLQQQPQQGGIFGTPDYLAPEILMGTGHGPEVDWWALGVIIFEFLTSFPPFNSDTPQGIFDNIVNLRIPWPPTSDEVGEYGECLGFPSVARDIVEKLLVIDPTKRLGHNGAAEVKAHPFFAGINWDTLVNEPRDDIFVPVLDDPEDVSYFEDHGRVNSDASRSSSSSPSPSPSLAPSLPPQETAPTRRADPSLDPDDCPDACDGYGDGAERASERSSKNSLREGRQGDDEEGVEEEEEEGELLSPPSIPIMDATAPASAHTTNLSSPSPLRVAGDAVNEKDGPLQAGGKIGKDDEDDDDDDDETTDSMTESPRIDYKSFTGIETPGMTFKGFEFVNTQLFKEKNEVLAENARDVCGYCDNGESLDDSFDITMSSSSL